MKPTEQRIKSVESRMRLDAHIVSLWSKLASHSDEFLTEADANVFAEITKHPAIQDKLKK
jgi:hypothetical protein